MIKKDSESPHIKEIEEFLCWIEDFERLYIKEIEEFLLWIDKIPFIDFQVFCRVISPSGAAIWEIYADGDASRFDMDDTERLMKEILDTLAKR